MAKEYILNSDGFADTHGQPAAGINFKYRLGREMDELIGLCKGIVSDGLVVEREAKYLENWLRTNAEIAQFWPAKELAGRLTRVMADGKLSEEERDELLLFLQHITGEVEDRMNLVEQLGGKKVTLSTVLPLDNPAPEIVFLQKHFCFTGKCLSGTRCWCESEVERRGGIPVSRSETCDFLVIGVLGSRDWAHSSHGRKIEAAVERKGSSGWPRIVAEDHWVKFLQQTPVSEDRP